MHVQRSDCRLAWPTTIVPTVLQYRGFSVPYCVSWWYSPGVLSSCPTVPLPSSPVYSSTRLLVLLICSLLTGVFIRRRCPVPAESDLGQSATMGSRRGGSAIHGRTRLPRARWALGDRLDFDSWGRASTSDCMSKVSYILRDCYPLYNQPSHVYRGAIPSTPSITLSHSHPDTTYASFSLLLLRPSIDLARTTPLGRGTTHPGTLRYLPTLFSARKYLSATPNPQSGTPPDLINPPFPNFV